MTRLALILGAFLPLLAMGQGTPPSSSYALKTQVRTQSALTRYVDNSSSSASDGAGCGATTTSPCLTITGALQQLPPTIWHDVLISVTGGTDYYATGSTTAGFIAPVQLQGVLVQGYQTREYTTPTTPATWWAANHTPRITIRGRWTQQLAAFTPTGVSVSASAYSATITKAAAGWSVNAYKGMFLEWTSGGSYCVAESSSTSASPYVAVNDCRWVITANDATTMTVTSYNGSSLSTTGLLTSNTYRVVSPTVKLHSGTSGAPTTPRAAGALEVSAKCDTYRPPSVTTLSSQRGYCVLVNGFEIDDGATATVMNPDGVELIHNVVKHDNSSPASILTAAVPSDGDAFISNVIYGQSTLRGGSYVMQGNAFFNDVSSGVALAMVNNAVSRTTNANYFLCSGGGSPIGLSHSSGAVLTTFQRNQIEGCTTGLLAGTNALMSSSTSNTYLNNTTAISVSTGAKVQLTSSDTFTGSTNDIVLDTGHASTFAQLGAAGMIGNPVTGSFVQIIGNSVGVTLLPQFATGSLPTASAGNASGAAYDTSLSQPSYSDGAAWMSFDALLAPVASVIDFGSTTNTCTVSSGITVTGAILSNACRVGFGSDASGDACTYTCEVTAADTAKVKACCFGTVDPASRTYTLTIMR